MGTVSNVSGATTPPAAASSKPVRQLLADTYKKAAGISTNAQALIEQIMLTLGNGKRDNVPVAELAKRQLTNDDVKNIFNALQNGGFTGDIKGIIPDALNLISKASPKTSKEVLDNFATMATGFVASPPPRVKDDKFNKDLAELANLPDGSGGFPAQIVWSLAKHFNENNNRISDDKLRSVAGEVKQLLSDDGYAHYRVKMQPGSAQMTRMNSLLTRLFEKAKIDPNSPAVQDFYTSFNEVNNNYPQVAEKPAPVKVGTSSKTLPVVQAFKQVMTAGVTPAGDGKVGVQVQYAGEPLFGTGRPNENTGAVRIAGQGSAVIDGNGVELDAQVGMVAASPTINFGPFVGHGEGYVGFGAGRHSQVTKTKYPGGEAGIQRDLKHTPVKSEPGQTPDLYANGSEQTYQTNPDGTQTLVDSDPYRIGYNVNTTASAWRPTGQVTYDNNGQVKVTTDREMAAGPQFQLAAGVSVPFNPLRDEQGRMLPNQSSLTNNDVFGLGVLASVWGMFDVLHGQGDIKSQTRAELNVPTPFLGEHSSIGISTPLTNPDAKIPGEVGTVQYRTGTGN